jgi:IS5 family transposase
VTSALQNFPSSRSGINRRIGVLRRRFGLHRCRYRGEAGLERWVGWVVLAYDLRTIARALAGRAR